MPFGISKSTNVILRVIMPLTSQPGSDGDRVSTGSATSSRPRSSRRRNPARIIWGVGPVFLLPAATNNSLGSEKFGLGPSVVALTQPGHGPRRPVQPDLVGEWRERSGDVNSTYLQPFANYNLGGACRPASAWRPSANWEADEAWTAPLLFNVSKVTLLGKRPVSFAAAAGPTIASPMEAPTGASACRSRSCSRSEEH